MDRLLFFHPVCKHHLKLLIILLDWIRPHLARTAI
jgi:hypothetical protein